MNDNDSVTLYGESIANFGAAYATMQEAVQSQGTTITSIQGQMQAMQQYCMAIGQQPPRGIYTMQQQQRGRRGTLRQPSTGGRGNPAPTSYEQPGGFPGSQRPAQLPTPIKTFKNWNYCHTFNEGLGRVSAINPKKGGGKEKAVRSILTALPFFLPFLGFIAKSRIFFILEPFSLPNVFCVLSCLF